MSLAAMGSLGNLSWAVPSLVLAVPGLLLVLAVLAQAVGGVLWLPVIRRRIGSFGVGGRAPPRTRRRRMPGVPSDIHRCVDPRHGQRAAPLPNGPKAA